MACSSEWNHSADPKSRMTQVKYTFERRVGFVWFKLFMRYQMDFKMLHDSQIDTLRNDTEYYSRSERCHTDTSTDK